MDFKRFKLTSKLFLLVAFANFIFAFIVKGFLKNPDMGKNFKGFNKQFFVSDIYLYIGLIWLIFAAIYLLDDYSGREYLSGVLKKLHFYLTLPAIILLVCIPILDTYHPTNKLNNDDTLNWIILLATLSAFVGLIIGTIFFITNLITGVLLLRKSWKVTN